MWLYFISAFVSGAVVGFVVFAAVYGDVATRLRDVRSQLSQLNSDNRNLASRNAVLEDARRNLIEQVNSQSDDLKAEASRVACMSDRLMRLEEDLRVARAMHMQCLVDRACDIKGFIDRTHTIRNLIGQAWGDFKDSISNYYQWHSKVEKQKSELASVINQTAAGDQSVVVTVEDERSKAMAEHRNRVTIVAEIVDDNRAELRLGSCDTIPGYKINYMAVGDTVRDPNDIVEMLGEIDPEFPDREKLREIMRRVDEYQNALCSV